jgi:hypothetical protein
MTLKSFATVAIVLIPSLAFAAGGGGTGISNAGNGGPGGPNSDMLSLPRNASRRALWLSGLLGWP